MSAATLLGPKLAKFCLKCSWFHCPSLRKKRLLPQAQNSSILFKPFLRDCVYFLDWTLVVVVSYHRKLGFASKLGFAWNDSPTIQRSDLKDEVAARGNGIIRRYIINSQSSIPWLGESVDELIWNLSRIKVHRQFWHWKFLIAAILGKLIKIRLIKFLSTCCP